MAAQANYYANDHNPGGPQAEFFSPNHEDSLNTLPETHLASVVEKKRLWWRNAVINLLFIASWYVNVFTVIDFFKLKTFSGLLLQLSYPSIINGCFQTSTLGFNGRSL
jgi:hypothetical protein